MYSVSLLGSKDEEQLEIFKPFVPNYPCCCVYEGGQEDPGEDVQDQDWGEGDPH